MVKPNKKLIARRKAKNQKIENTTPEFKNKLHFYKFMLKGKDEIPPQTLRTYYGNIKDISKKRLNLGNQFLVDSLSNLVFFGKSPVVHNKERINKGYSNKLLSYLTSFLSLKDGITNKKIARRLKTVDNIKRDLEVYFSLDDCPLTKEEIIFQIENF